MSKHIRKLVPLLLCLLLMACLLPAAYAEAAAVSTLEELQAALNNHISNIMFANDMIVPETDITVPSGVTLTVRGVTFWANNIEVQPGGSIIADSGNMSTMNRLTVNGSLTVNDAVVITDGSSWDNLKNASITYGNAESKISFHFPTFNVQEARAAIAKAAEITSQRVDPLVFINYAAEISDNYVIPEGVKVEHTGLTVTTNGTLTVNGTLRTMLDGILTVNGNLINNGILNVWDNGTINITGNLTNSERISVRDFGAVNVVTGGSMTNNGKIDLSTSGVLRIGGIFTGNPGSRIDVPDADLTDPENIQPRVIREDGGEFNNMSGIVFSKSVLDSGVDCSAIIQNIDMNNYCRHVDHQRSEIAYYPGSVLNFEGMFPVGGKNIENLEVHGLDTLTLSDNVEVPVLDDGTVSKVDMHATKLVVPDGKSVLVNGVLAAKELVIESGGSVTVNGYLDAVNGITLNNGGALTVNNTQIDAGYVPTTDIEALKNIVYNGDASMQLHLVVWPSDDVPNAITTASAVVDDHVSCMVELRTGWTVTDATDCHLITLKVRKDGTLTVNGELIVKDLIVDDGGNVVIGDSGSISYADRVEVTTLAQLKNALNANTSRIVVNQDITLDASLTIPESCYVKVRHGSTLTVPQNMTLTINGKIEASFNGVIDVLGTLQNNGEIEMFDGGVIDVKGTYNHADGKAIVFTKNGNPDAVMPKLIVEQGASCTLNLFRTEEGLVAADVIEGVDLSNYCFHSNHSKPKRVYYPGNALPGDGGLNGLNERDIDYFEVHGIETITLAEDTEISVLNDGTPLTINMPETTLIVPSGFTLTVNGFLRAEAVEVQTGGSITVNGELKSRALEIQAGGSATVNEGGYLDIGGGGFNILEGGTLTLNNTWIDTPYPKSNSDTLNHIVYNGDAGMTLHLTVGNPDGVASAFADAAAASSQNVYCIVELRTDWTMEGTINAPKVAFEIPGKYTVTINGNMKVGEIYDWGPINLTGTLEAGELSLNGNLTVGSNATLEEVKLIDLNNGRPMGSITLADGTSRVNLRSDGLSEALMSDWITLQNADARVRVYYHAKDDTDFASMMDLIRDLPANIAGALTLEYAAVIQGNVDFPGTELRVEGRKGGSLTIAEGAVLTASNINFKNANVTISGTFIAGPSYRHSGSLTLNDANSTLTVTDTGILGGYQCTVEVPRGVNTASCVFGINPGQMKDVSHPYRPNYQIYLIVAEMALPSGLKTIESEAFAGGSFSSVYIPESVTDIAFDAFGDRTGLKVYGGTAAETFADDHGFPFAPPNLATNPA